MQYSNMNLNDIIFSMNKQNKQLILFILINFALKTFRHFVKYKKKTTFGIFYFYLKFM